MENKSEKNDSLQTGRNDFAPADQKELLPVELVERTKAHVGAVLTVYDDLVRVKGHEVHWDYIHHDGAAAVVPVTDDGRILMVRQYRHPLKRFTLELPAGKVDEPGEDKMICARRELEEETGYASDDLSFLIYVNTTVAFCDELIGIYVARNLYKTRQNLDDDEELNVEAWSLEDLKKEIFAGRMTDGKTVAGILAYAATL